jgi:glyoxylase-like metal-dependent hydrolase (beta-lactamase superfamily II)
MDIIFDDLYIKIIRLELGPYHTNSYIVIDVASRDSLIVDAPSDADEILKHVQGTKPRFIVLTHNHIDHIQALSELKRDLGVPLAAHPLDSSGLPETVDIDLKDGDHLTVGRLLIKTLHTPGHTAGSICLMAGRHLLAGDTIFPGGPGYTSTPDDLDTILQSIETKILLLPDDTIIYPGHGPTTLLADEKKAIASFLSIQHSSDLHGDVLWS